MKCRLCGKAAETQAHVPAGCSALAQSKYMTRHNGALKVIFYEFLKDLDLMTSIPPWYSQNTPKPLYENEKGKALWDVPLYAEYAEVRNNRIDCTVIDKKKKKVVLLEMSCPWVSNREIKCAEKTSKYAPLRYELRRRYPGYKIEQHNIIIDVLGGSSRSVKESLRQLVGSGRCNSVLFLTKASEQHKGRLTISANRMAPKNITTCNNIGIKAFLATPVYSIVELLFTSIGSFTHAHNVLYMLFLASCIQSPKKSQ